MQVNKTYIVLVAENVIVNVVFLWGLWGQHEGLHETPHWIAIVGQLPGHLQQTREQVTK